MTDHEIDNVVLPFLDAKKIFFARHLYRDFVRVILAAAPLDPKARELLERAGPLLFSVDLESADALSIEIRDYLKGKP